MRYFQFPQLPNNLLGDIDIVICSRGMERLRDGHEVRGSGGLQTGCDVYVWGCGGGGVLQDMFFHYKQVVLRNIICHAEVCVSGWGGGRRNSF